MFNFACLMNNAYRDNKKPHVHFHFIPRYKNELKLFNKIYKDRQLVITSGNGLKVDLKVKKIYLPKKKE